MSNPGILAKSLNVNFFIESLDILCFVFFNKSCIAFVFFLLKLDIMNESFYFTIFQYLGTDKITLNFTHKTHTDSITIKQYYIILVYSKKSLNDEMSVSKIQSPAILGGLILTLDPSNVQNKTVVSNPEDIGVSGDLRPFIIKIIYTDNANSTHELIIQPKFINTAGYFSDWPEHLYIINDIHENGEGNITIKESGFNTEYSGDNSRFLEEFGHFEYTDLRTSISELYNWYKKSSDINNYCEKLN